MVSTWDLGVKCRNVRIKLEAECMLSCVMSIVKHAVLRQIEMGANSNSSMYVFVMLNVLSVI